MKKPNASPDLNRQAKLEAFDRLLTIMDELRENCPWDKKQTLESLRHLTIEETYELSDAILEGDLPEIRKEIGDLMLHMVFYARMVLLSEKNTPWWLLLIMCLIPPEKKEETPSPISPVRGPFRTLQKKQGASTMLPQ